jgi:hypothetical protein
MYEDAGLLIDDPGSDNPTKDAHAATTERVTSVQDMIHCQHVVGVRAVPLSQCIDWTIGEGKIMDDAPWEISLDIK